MSIITTKNYKTRKHSGCSILMIKTVKKQNNELVFNIDNGAHNRFYRNSSLK